MELISLLCMEGENGRWAPLCRGTSPSQSSIPPFSSLLEWHWPFLPTTGHLPSYAPLTCFGAYTPPFSWGSSLTAYQSTWEDVWCWCRSITWAMELVPIHSLLTCLSLQVFWSLWLTYPWNQIHMEELEWCSLFCLIDFSGQKEVFVGLFNQGMLLLSTTMAVLGGSCHTVEFSNLIPSTIPSPDGGGSGIEVKCFLWPRQVTNTAQCVKQVLGILLDNAKNNQTGHKAEHEAIHYHYVELWLGTPLLWRSLPHSHLLPSL